MFGLKKDLQAKPNSLDSLLYDLLDWESLMTPPSGDATEGLWFFLTLSASTKVCTECSARTEWTCQNRSVQKVLPHFRFCTFFLNQTEASRQVFSIKATERKVRDELSSLKNNGYRWRSVLNSSRNVQGREIFRGNYTFSHVWIKWGNYFQHFEKCL